jgi:hypothetical protein
VAAHNAVVLKAETIIDKTEWVTKIKSIIDSKESATKRPNALEDGLPMRQSPSDGSLVSCNMSCFKYTKLHIMLIFHKTSACS